MDLELKDKIALVTGASRGIGRAIARGLAAEGARVVLCARDKATLETAAAEIARETRAEPVSVAGDLSRLEDVERVVREVHGRFGRIDILVNNAGAIRGGDFFTIPDAQWADVRCHNQRGGAGPTDYAATISISRRATMRALRVQSAAPGPGAASSLTVH